MKTLHICTALVFIFLFSAKAQTNVTDLVFTIKVSVTANNIVLTWNKLPGVLQYNVLRKSRGEKNFAVIASNLNEEDTTYTDLVVNGSSFEYGVQSSSNNNISGYVYVGIELPVKHSEGEILLLIDDTYQNSASAEIRMYMQDLVKEGWLVSTEYVARSQSVVSVKQLILNHYNANPTGLKGVVLLGHVPVPYSGKVAPDAHTDHLGAWPSDIYYADVQVNQTDAYTDNSLHSVTSSSTRNHNIVGDTKFDASNKSLTAEYKLFVGRIDVFNMPSIHSSDVFMFKRYLLKNHSYRTGIKKFRNNALVDDNFGYFSGEAFAQNGWRNFSSLVGSANTTSGDYFTDMKLNSYIWSYACGGGWYTGASGVGTTNDFQSDKIESVFTMLYGSYFGDWDNQNNFLRAPIASPSATLVSVWGGRPNWYFHTMAMGEPIGYSYLNSIDNSDTYFPKGYYSNKIHQSLQGDPTLKMNVISAPTFITINSIENNSKMKVEWIPSTEDNILGYYIYKANSIEEPFELLTPNYVTSNFYIDEEADMTGSSTYIYMVRAVRLEQTLSGSYYNLSPGIISLEAPMAITLPVNLLTFTGRVNEDRSNTLYWQVENETQLAGYAIEYSTNQIDFQEIGFQQALSASTSKKDYTFHHTIPAVESYYRIKSVDIDGKFTYSTVVHLMQESELADVQVYPSPFTNNVQVKFSASSEGGLSLKLYNMMGSMVKNYRYEKHVGINEIRLIDTESLQNGFYLLQIEDMDDNTSTKVKILKQ